MKHILKLYWFHSKFHVADKNGENGENGDKENGDKKAETEAETEEKDLENNVNQLEVAADNFSAPTSLLAAPEEDKKLTRRGSAKRKKSLAVPEKPAKKLSLRRKSHKV